MTIDSARKRWLPRHRAEGPREAPALVLGPSLGTSSRVWEPQAAGLARDRRVVRWELPGHGGAAPETPADGVSVAWLGEGVLALADALGLERFAYAGISLGGAVGTWLAVHHPERLDSLALLCTSAHFGPPEGWHERAALVRAEGTGAVADSAAGRWFTPDFAGDEAARALVADTRAADPAAYARLCEALAAFDLRAELSRVTVPTLVVAGREDPATPVAHARELADGIPGAGLTEVPGARTWRTSSARATYSPPCAGTWRRRRLRTRACPTPRPPSRPNTRGRTFARLGRCRVIRNRTRSRSRAAPGC
ncbi:MULTISPECIES: alpha/beta fold hydrolase [unclassified Streptomyces]|uniref:alpha/beta fold hydrolase n=1 Tax=unclassified Streptomyces TaxID=2593676 RepID=UPI002DD7B033|nr:MULTISPECIES: alpha/beta fold hydrolase [unclassified Streptomyces]